MGTALSSISRETASRSRHRPRASPRSPSIYGVTTCHILRWICGVHLETAAVRGWRRGGASRRSCLGTRTRCSRSPSVREAIQSSRRTRTTPSRPGPSTPWTMSLLPCLRRIRSSLPISTSPSTANGLRPATSLAQSRLWDLKSLTFVRSLPALAPTEIRSLRWRPGKLLLAQTDKVGWLAIRSLAEMSSQIKSRSTATATASTSPAGHRMGNRWWLDCSAERSRNGVRAASLLAFKARHPDAVQGLPSTPAPIGFSLPDSFGNLWAWNIKTREKLIEFPPTGEAQDSVDLTDHGRTALTAGNGGKLTLYDLGARAICSAA